MSRSLKSPLQLGFGENSLNSFVYVAHATALNVGNSDSYSVAVWFQASKRSGQSITEKWYDDGPPTSGKYPWAIRGPNSVGQITGAIYDGVNNPGKNTGATSYSDNQTHLIVMVRDFGGDTVQVYVDTTDYGAVTDTTTGDVSSDRHMMVGGRGFGFTEHFEGLIGNFALYSGTMNSTDVTNLYNGTEPSLTKLLGLPMKDGSGFMINDTSGNGNHGKMGAARWRLVENYNLVCNGDFEIAPTGSTATTTTARYLDGTAGGNTNTQVYGWYFTFSGAGNSALIDSSDNHSGSYSLKTSVVATAGYVEVKSDRSTAYTNARTGGSGFQLKPSTSYTCTFWMKTANIAGDSNDGAYVAVLECNSSGATLATRTSTKIKTNTSWTQYSFNWTTSATANRGHVECRFYGHTGTATLTGDAWFDDVELMQTTHPRKLATRTLASSRTLIS